MPITLRAKAETWLNHIWYDGQPPPLLLRTLSAVYQHLLRKPEFVRPETLGLPPIVIVGNLTVGGSGKTPVVIWLVEQAKAAGLKVGVISRGYGGSNAKTNHALEVQIDTDWRVCGDEALLIKRRTGARVAVAKDRVQAACLIADGLDLIISDDGLQNPKIPRTLEVLVIDGARRFGNEKLLPAGPLRAPLPKELPARYPIRICNGAQPQAGEYAMQLIGDAAIQTSTGDRKHLSEFSDVFALAGIGNPARYYEKLGSHIGQVSPIEVGDHQLLASEQMQKLLAEKPVITTEKDALKYPAHANLWVLSVDAELDTRLWDHLAAKLF
jgi:tetraacyldisaccharide 4'-kinase